MEASDVKTGIGGRQRGISLLESLVALVVLSVGLLGVAGLQMQSLAQNRSAYLESQATNMAYDMMDRLRANVEAVEAGQYGQGLGSTPPSGDDLAAQDRRSWLRDLAATLPQGQGAIAVNGERVTVTVRWQDAAAADDVREIVLVSGL